MDLFFVDCSVLLSAILKQKWNLIENSSIFWENHHFAILELQKMVLINLLKTYLN
jgi:hypothetical protein